MVASVSELIVPRTADAIVTEQLAVLDAEDFPVTSWQSGSAPRDLVKADATAMARLDANVADLAKAAFGDDAEGDWLTLWALSRFSVERSVATYTEGYVQLACASGAGPHTISAAQLLVTDGVRRWRSTNTSSITVTSATPVSIPVRSEVAGSDGVVANGTITTIVSPALAGLSVNNPSYASGTWITTSGDDAESDASLLARCRAKWSTLGRGANTTAYRYWATNAPSAPTVTRASVVPGSGDGTLTVYIAQSAVTATGGQVALVQSFLDVQKPVTDTVTVVAAAVVTVNMSGTVEFSSAAYNTPSAHTAIEDAITAVLNGQPMGQRVDIGAIYRAIYDATPGVFDVDIASPSGDTAIGASQISVTGTLSLTYSP